MEDNKSNTDKSKSSTFNESGELYVWNDPSKQPYISRWVYSLTEEELEQAFTNLELAKNGTPFDQMMRLQRELLVDYEPADFVENAEITEDQKLEAHRKLLVSGFLEKTVTALKILLIKLMQQED